MASDIFSRMTDAYGGAFSADAAKVTFASDPGVLGSVGANGGGVGMLVQQLQFNYQQQVTRIYEIGTNVSFYVAGRTQGSMTVGRLLGPRPVALAFYRKYGDVCQASTNHLDVEMATGCTGAGNLARVAFKLKFCVITTIGVSVTAQDMMINEQLQLMFCSLGMQGVNGY